MGERFVIAGGGVAGHAFALAAARQGHDVVLCERDTIPTAATPDEAFEHVRRGAPQVQQTHGFLARLTLVLRDRFPDLLDALHDAGARIFPLTGELGDPQPGDEDLAILLARRTTLDWVLRRALASEPRIELRQGEAVAGVVAEETVVRGARLASGEELAGTVIASMGRRDDAPAWLSEIGVTVAEEEHSTRLIYLTRWYRQSGNSEMHMTPRLGGGDLGYVRYLAVPCDGGTFSITVAVNAADRELRAALLDEDRFDTMCRVLEGPDEFFRHGSVSPLGPVRPMGGLVNRLRRFTDEAGEPLVTGFHAVGDSHTATNPLYGRGCTLAFVQAALLADAVAAHPDDRVARARTYEAASQREVEPWFHSARQWDEMRWAVEASTEVRRGDDESSSTDSEAKVGASPAGAIARVFAEGRTDPVIGRAMIRLFNLLKLPDELMTDPEFVARVAPIVARTDAPPPPRPEGPTRSQILAGSVR